MATVRVFNQYIPTTVVLLALLETAIFVTSAYAGVTLRFLGMAGSIEHAVGPVLPKAVLFNLVLGASMTSMGLYQRRFREGVAGVVVRVGVSFGFAAVALSLVFYLFPSLFLGRGALGLALVIAFFGVVITRIIFYSLIDQETLKRRVLVLGAGRKASSLLQLRRLVDQRGFMVMGFIGLKGEHVAVDKERMIPRNGRSLLELARRQEVDEVVVAVDDRRRGLPLDELLDCKMSGVEVIDLMTFFERETGKIKLDLLQPSWLIFSQGFERGLLQEYTKRAFDIVVSSVLLLAALPIILFTAIAIFLGDGGPVLFRQIRVGQHSRSFCMYKFRSMTADAESDGQVRWAQAGDQRVTKVGVLIRKLRIDELPQILNVLKGDMSFVGPRPERPEFVHQLSAKIPYYKERHRVKPGITGWAQICYPYGASEKDSLEKLQFDLYYAKNHNIFLDFTILLQTVEVIFFGKGAR